MCYIDLQLTYLLNYLLTYLLTYLLFNTGYYQQYTDMTYPTLLHNFRPFRLAGIVSKTSRHSGHVVFVGKRLLGVDVSEVPAERLAVKAVTQCDSV